jgi:hypothetical protein
MMDKYKMIRMLKFRLINKKQHNLATHVKVTLIIYGNAKIAEKLNVLVASIQLHKDAKFGNAASTVL